MRATIRTSERMKIVRRRRWPNKLKPCRVFFYNCRRVKSSLLSLELSFSISAVILAEDSILCDDSRLCDDSKLRFSIINKNLLSNTIYQRQFIEYHLGKGSIKKNKKNMDISITGWVVAMVDAGGGWHHW